jgi:hypothetical protein
VQAAFAVRLQLVDRVAAAIRPDRGDQPGVVISVAAGLSDVVFAVQGALGPDIR